MQDSSPSLHSVASQVDSLIRKFDSLDHFRERVRRAAQEYTDALVECERRAELRREFLDKEGICDRFSDAAIEGRLPSALHPDSDPPTDPLPVSGEKVSLNFKYAALSAIYDAQWVGSELIAPWGVVTSGVEVRPASGLPSEWKTPEEAGSYQSASWYWRQVKTTRELDDRNVTVVASWVPDVMAELTKAFPKRGSQDSMSGKEAKRKGSSRGPNQDECKALFVALLTLLPEEQHLAALQQWPAETIVDEITNRLKLEMAPKLRTFQRMLVREGYRLPKGAGKNADKFNDTYWDDPDRSERRRLRR